MFTFNLNDPTAFTKANVAKLIGSVDLESGRHWHVRVRRDGSVWASLFIGSTTPQDVLFTLPTMPKSHFGPAAQRDAKWVDKVYRSLEANWPERTSSHPDWA